MKNTSRFWFSSFLILLLMLLSTSGVFGQDYLSLQLTVLDQQNGTISQGKVKLLRSDGSLIIEKPIDVNNPITLEGITTKDVIIEIESPGFEIFKEKIVLNHLSNFFTAKLEINQVEVEVKVELSELEKRLNQAFSSMLTDAEINSLPNNPRELEKELKRRYGDDLVIRINGFEGGSIPPKEAIKSIQINRSSFDAEYHELGQPNINIITKALNKRIVGTIMFDYGNSVLNARNAFVNNKSPERTNSISTYVSGPLIKAKSSFNASFSRFSKSEEPEIFAKVPPTLFSESSESKIKSSDFLGGVDYDINANFTARLDYRRRSNQSFNIGVGGLNLPERGFFTQTASNEVKLSVNGTFAERIANQLRLKIGNAGNHIKSSSQTSGIEVADTFNAGGIGLNSSVKTDQFELFEMISFGTNRHFIKLGGEFRFERMKQLSVNGNNGNFFFKSLEDYLLGRPSIYTRNEGETRLLLKKFNFSVFAQDDFRITKRLNIGLGLRYEVQNYLADFNNFSPRLSATVALDKNGRFILRTGAGILYHWRDTENIRRVLGADGTQSRQLIILNPGFPNPYGAGQLQKTLPPSVYREATNLRNPYVFVTQTALNINLTDGVKFNASYKYEKGVHQFRSRDINAPINGIRPNSSFSLVRLLESSGNSTLNSFEASGEGVFFKRIRLYGRYRLSKQTNDYSDAFALPVDNYNLRLEKGASNIDRRHDFTTYLDFSPFKDLTLIPSYTITSPLPYNLTTGLDNNGDTVFNDRPIGVYRNTARGTWTKTANVNVYWSFPIFKRDVSVKTNDGNSKLENIPDILKYHKITLSINIDNLFNSTNKVGFVGNKLSPFWGQATFASPARNITFGLRFIYF